MTKKISGVYLIRNKLNDKCYVGVSVNIYSRWRQHKYWAKNEGVVSKITNSIKKNGIENFDFSIIHICEKEEFEAQERFWIKQHDSVTNGYNLTHGGNIRKVISDETKAKMSKSRLGVPKSDAHKRKIAETNGSKKNRELFSKINLGRKLSDETRKKMSESRKGKKISEETKRKMNDGLIAFRKRWALQSPEQRPKMGRPPKVNDEPRQTQTDSPSRD